MTRFDDFIARAKATHGAKFDASGLATQFIQFYNNGLRVRVRVGSEIISGRIGVTTGWVPCFLLMRRSDAFGSSICLDACDEVISVQFGNNARPYIPLNQIDSRRLQACQ